MSKPRYKIVNYYEKVDKEDNALYDYPNKPLIQINLPFRGLIVGPSGTGKTNIMLNLISAIGIWDKIVILAKNLEEPLYKYTIKTIQDIEKKQKRRILLAIRDIADLPPLEAFHENENSLLIVDDFVADKPKLLEPLEHIWLRGRKNGISAVFISQSYFRTLKFIRQNCNYIFIKKMGNAKDMSRIAGEYALGAAPEEIKAKYEKAVDGDFTNFFLIDTLTNDPSLQFRQNFDPMD